MSSTAPSARTAERPDGPLGDEFARFFASSHDVLAILDARGRVMMISPSVERVLGHAAETVIGQRLVRWVHRDDQTHVRSRLRKLRDDHFVADIDARLLGADGRWVPMRWSLSVGAQRRIYAVGRDRTDDVRARRAVLREEVAELRLRTAMELHDGVLQTLTGASLQIEVARRLLRSDPDRVEAILFALGESVSAEQREMRLYVDEMKGERPGWADDTRALGQRIETIIERVGMIWGVGTSVEAHVAHPVSPELGRQVLRIVQEATVNAARHGGAETVAVRVEETDSEIVIAIRDDGTGFSFRGEFDHQTLKEKRLGPLSLKHRVEDAGGRISINSTASGASVVVTVPTGGEDQT